MDQRQIDLVQRSFERAMRIGPHVAATFYAELFAVEPALRAMFKGDMIAQGEKLTGTLRYIINGLNDPETVLSAARELAIRHLNYGVEARHYAAVGIALLRTLRHELGADFAAETRAAWTAAYALLSDAMCEAAYQNAALAR